MTDLVITASSLKRDDLDGRFRVVQAGATIAAGQSVYRDMADADQWKPADANVSAIIAGRDGVGIALNAAYAGQLFVVFLGGRLQVGAILTVGQTYVVSANPGGIAPISDAASGWFMTILAVAVSTSVLWCDFNVTGAQKP